MLSFGLPIIRRHTSIQLRIGLAFALLALVLFIGVGAMSGSQAALQVEDEIGAALDQVASRMAVNLDASLYERRREILNLAALDSLLDARVAPQAWRAMAERLQSSLRSYSWIGLADPTGRVLAATGSVLEGADVSHRTWFSMGLKGAYVGDVHEAMLLAKALPARPSQEPLRLVDFAAPVRAAGQTIGVLGAHLNIDWIEARRRFVLGTLNPARGVQILIVDRAGQVVLGPGWPRWNEPLDGGPESLLARHHAMVGWSDGRRYLTSAVRTQGYDEFPGLGWTVVVRQPDDTALMHARQLRTRIWGLGLIGAVLFGALGWALAGRLTETLRDVSRKAQRIAADAEAAAADPGPVDEVAQLARSLNTLSEQLRRRETELQAAHESLEARVHSRTQSLRQTNAELQSFSRSVSHDIKGPIGSIGMLLKNLLEGEAASLSSGARRMLSLLVAECQRLCLLVDELMALAMVEQRPMLPSAVPMQDLVLDVKGQLQAQATGQSTATPEFVVSALPTVQGDAVLLRQVWQNLLGNAWKFSARVARPRVEVSAELQDQEIVFSVRDNGAGFDMAQVDRLFGVFQRLHRTSEFEGTGVGLSIVKRAVQRHGGRVWAHSEPGRGAQFFFSLPVRPPAGPDGTWAAQL